MLFGAQRFLSYVHGELYLLGFEVLVFALVIFFFFFDLAKVLALYFTASLNKIMISLFSLSFWFCLIFFSFYSQPFQFCLDFSSMYSCFCFGIKQKFFVVFVLESSKNSLSC